MNKELKRLRKIKAANCISIILNTHRTHPDSEKDAIVLKNLVAEAAERLTEHEDKRVARSLIEKLETLAKSVDHRQNLDSLVLFVNEDISEIVKLPIAVTDRVIIGDSFATRDLVRSMNLETHYYILVLGKDEARLIEALNDKEVQEFGGPFPIRNADHSKTFSAQAKTTNREGSLIAEFYNFVDKEVNKIRKENPLPVLISSDDENYGEYLKIADEKDSIMTEYLNRSRQNEKANAIVADAWELVRTFTQKKNDSRRSELMQAVNENKFLSDTNEINNAIAEGRVQTLFVETGLYQAATMESGNIVYQNEPSATPAIDDIYDDLIERNMDLGGDVVFLPKGELDKFNGFAAVTRY